MHWCWYWRDWRDWAENQCSLEFISTPWEIGTCVYIPSTKVILCSGFARHSWVLWIAKLSHTIGTASILEMVRAYGLRPRLCLLLTTVGTVMEFLELSRLGMGYRYLISTIVHYRVEKYSWKRKHVTLLYWVIEMRKNEKFCGYTSR